MGLSSKYSVDFDESSEKVNKLCKYKKVRFFVSDGPSLLSQGPQYVGDLYLNKVRLLVRTNRCHYNSTLFEHAGVAVLDIPFKRFRVPEEEELDTFIGLLHRLFDEHKRLAVAVQGFEDGPFIIVYALMNLGMSRLDALATVREAEGEACFEQLQKLKKLEKQLEAQRLIIKELETNKDEEYPRMEEEKRSGQPFLSCIASACKKLTYLFQPSTRK